MQKFRDLLRGLRPRLGDGGLKEEGQTGDRLGNKLQTENDRGVMLLDGSLLGGRDTESTFQWHSERLLLSIEI